MLAKPASLRWIQRGKRLACGQSIMGYLGSMNILFIIDSYGK